MRGRVALADDFAGAQCCSDHGEEDGPGSVLASRVRISPIPFDPTQRADPKSYGKSLRDILKPVAKQLNEFKAYAIAVRANELRKASKEHLFTKG